MGVVGGIVAGAAAVGAAGIGIAKATGDAAESVGDKAKTPDSENVEE